MADDASTERTPTGRPASGGTSPSSSGPAPGPGGSPLDDLEGDPFGEGADPFGAADPFGGGGFGSEPPAVMMTKFWISQNPLVSIGLAFAAGTFIGALRQ